MKKKLLYAVLLGTFSMYSCQKDDLQISGENVETLIDFQGEQVLMPSGLSKADFDEYLQDKESVSPETSNLRISGELSPISEDEFFDIVTKIVKKYPDMAQEEFSDADLKTISKSIPSINSKTSAKNKKALVWDYFNVLAKKELEGVLNSYSNKGGRVSGGIDNLTGYEVGVLASDPFAASCWAIGRLTTDTFGKSIYGDPSYKNDNKKANAFRHSALNAFSIREMNVRHPDKHYAIHRIRKFACAHEYENVGGTWQPVTTNAHIMDLHNNLVGRTLMYDKVSTFLGRVSYVPSNNYIRDIIVGMAYNKKTDASQIFSMNPAHTLYNLGNQDNAYNYDMHSGTFNNLAYLED